MDVVGWLVEPFTHDDMRLALAAALTAAVVCGVLSCWVVLLGWSLMGDAVSHAVLPGIVIASLLGTPFAVGAVLFGLLAVALIAVARSTSRVRPDAATAVVLTTMFALGLVLAALTPSRRGWEHVLFGDLLGIGVADLIQIVVLGAITLAVVLVKRRDLVLHAFDPAHAGAVGLSLRGLGVLLLVLLTLATVVAVPTAGVVLALALVVVPGATAYLLTDRFAAMLVLAPALAAASAVIGLYASYRTGTPPGGTIVLTMGVLFALAYLFAPAQGVVPRFLRHRAAVMAEVA